MGITGVFNDSLVYAHVLMVNMKDILGHVVEFSGDQHGSRFIQQKLEGATAEERQAMLDELTPETTLQLIQDVFGNYVRNFKFGAITVSNLLVGHSEDVGIRQSNTKESHGVFYGRPHSSTIVTNVWVPSCAKGTFLETCFEIRLT